MQHYLEDITICQAIEYLERHLIVYVPEKYVLEQIRTVRDVYEHRMPLKTFVGTDSTVSHVARIIVTAICDGRRMRTLDCLKVLRALVKSSTASELKPDTIEMLFRIYQEFIFRDNEALQWCVSAILKGKVLSDTAVDWLVKNSDESVHIANRLLLYPGPHPEIRKWAERVYREGGLPDRRSEVMAVLLTPENAESFAVDNELNTFVWAVFKAHLSHKEKITLLDRHFSLEAFGSVIEIADRLESPELLRKFLDKLKQVEQANNALQADCLHIARSGNP